MTARFTHYTGYDNKWPMLITGVLVGGDNPMNAGRLEVPYPNCVGGHDVDLVYDWSRDPATIDAIFGSTKGSDGDFIGNAMLVSHPQQPEDWDNLQHNENVFLVQVHGGEIYFVTALYDFGEKR